MADKCNGTNGNPANRGVDRAQDQSGDRGRAGEAMNTCKYGDPFCPCQDGDTCHYEGENPMKPPRGRHDPRTTETDRERSEEENCRVVPAVSRLELHPATDSGHPAKHRD